MTETYFIREKKERDYTVLDNTFLRDDKLSWKAKGVFSYILSLPEDWKIYMGELEKHATDGKDSLRSAINELVEAGYIVKAELKDKGKFAGYSYTIIENPVNRIGKTVAVNPKSENPKSENPQLLNTNNTKYLNKQSTEELNSEKPAKKTKSFVPPTLEEIQSYVTEKNLSVDPKKFYTYFNEGDWIDSKGNKVKNWKQKILTWEQFNNNAPKKEPVKNYVTYTNTEKVDTSDCPF